MAAHRYWRILILQADAAVAHVGASEVELRVTLSGADVTGSGTASASSVSGADAAANAFDDNASTNWSSNGFVAGGEWLKYDFGVGNSYSIIEVAWTTRSADQDGPVDLFLQYSDDDSAWYTSLAFFDQTEFTAAAQQYVYNASSSGTVVAADVFPPKMTAASTPSPYVISASTEFSGAYVAWYACDLDLASEWFANTNTGWLKVDLGSGNAKTVNSVGLYNYQAATRMPNDFTVRGSNNDADWTTVATVIDQSAWDNNTIRTFSVSSPGSYRYYKLDITQNNGDGLVGLAGFYLFVEPLAEITGTLAATESGSDTCLMTGSTIFATGTMAATETGSDTCAMTGLVGASTGTMAAIETGSDTCAMTGTVLVQGTMAATESGADTCTMTGVVYTSANLVVSLPAITAYFEAKGAYGSLVVELPKIVSYFEAIGPRCDMQVDLPAIESLFNSGSSLVVDIPLAEALFNAVVGATGGLFVDLPPIGFAAESGATFSSFIPSIEALFTGTSGLAASLDVNLPAITALLEGKTGQFGTLDVTLPFIRTLFTASQPTQGVLLVEFPPLQVLLSGSVGTVGSLVVTLHELEALLTGYPETTAELLVSLPAIRSLFEGDMTGRFDDYILQWVRPS